jgi:hypothetical protein
MINNIFMDVKSAYWMKLVKRERERERGRSFTRKILRRDSERGVDYDD